MLSVNAVFPIDGRAATMIRSAGWKPDVISSRSLKPLATPVIVLPPRCSASMRSIVGQSSSLMRVKPSFVCCWLTWKIFDSASSSSSRRRALALERLGDDRRRDLDQPAKNRLLANDLRVILDVRRRRHGVDEEADVVLAARRIELAATAELFGERQRIDDAAALGDRHHRAEDPAMALGVEHRVVDVLDRAEHRVLVDQHRGQHRLLGVLRVRRTPIAVWITRRRAGAIEYSTGELDIFPGGALPSRIPEKRGGVIRDDQAAHRNTDEPGHATCRSRASCPSNVCAANVPERDDHLWAGSARSAE